MSWRLIARAGWTTRDLLVQIRNYSAFMDLPLEINQAYFDVAVENYFTVVG